MNSFSTEGYSIDSIIEKYITACSTLNFDSFSNILQDPRVEVKFPSKKNYEKYIRSLLRSLRAEGFQSLQLMIEDEPGLPTGFIAYNFYHHKYVYPRLNTQVYKSESKIILDILPF